ncbi:MAG: HPr family phosphocarrier protein [Chitinispirillaceae bacterium]|nr:HPr family phosphocarrier protein [Chitinispirillaceae bacterium]
MRSTTVTINTKAGLHLRIAGRVCEQTRQSRSSITVRKGDKIADGRSIIDLLMLDAPSGTELEIVADGEDEEVIIAEIQKIFVDGEVA